jgi:hypothetical protein
MNTPSPKPEIGPTFLSANILYASLLGSIFLASIFLAIIMADSGLTNIRHAADITRVVIGAFFLLFGLVVLLIGGGIFFPAAMQLWYAIQLERHGKIINAKIIEKRLEADKKGNYYCFIVYAYDENFTVKQSVRQDEYEELEVGDRVKVRSLPKAPEIARLEREARNAE